MPEPTLTTARTPRLELPFLFPGQAQKEAFVNEALVRLDGLIQPLVQGEAAEPPAAPSSGDSYIVAEGATGDWAGREAAIAIRSEGFWLFAPPFEGARVHDAASGSLSVYSETEGWRRADAPVLPSGGTVQDIEAREAIAAIVARLHRLAIFSA